MGERNLDLDDAKDRRNGKSVAAKARPTDGWGIGGERSLPGDWGNFPEKNQSLPPKRPRAPLGKGGPSLQPARVDPKPVSETIRPFFQPPLKAGEIEGGAEARARRGGGG